MSSVYLAASKNRGKSCLWESEYSWDYWERVKIQSCSQFHDRRLLFLKRTRNERCQKKGSARANELELSGDEKVPGTLPMRTREQHAQNCERMLSCGLSRKG